MKRETKRRGSNHSREGRLIVIEGIDGSGKETQARMLTERLKSEKIPCLGMSFPRYGTPTGDLVRKHLSGEFGEPSSVCPKFASALYALDRFAASDEMKKILGSGENLILDRYYQSNVAFQSAKAENCRGKRDVSDFVEKLELETYGIPREDAVLFLHVPAETASELLRREGRMKDGHEENLEYMKRVEREYLEMAEKGRNWVKIDCAPDGTPDSLKTPEEIHGEVYDRVIEIFNRTEAN